MIDILRILGIAVIACGTGALLFAWNPKFEPDCPGTFVRWKAFLVVYCIPAVIFPLIVVLAMIRLGLFR